jgi:two-component system, cell cycle sensor histidine kinase and response regulator CckA
VKAEDRAEENLIRKLRHELEHSETLRKRAEESLKESLSMTSSMVEAFDGLVYICSKNYEVEFANKYLIERTGYNPIGQKCYKALHNLDEICPWCVNDRVFKGEIVRWEVQSPKDNHWYYIVNTPIHHTDGNVSKMAMIQDINERKLAEEELLKLRLGIELSNEAIFITDINGTIVYENPAFEKIYGYSREEALGKTPRILKSGVLSQEVYKQFWETLLAKKVVTGELINKTKDGRLLNIDGSANPILDKDGNITGFLAIQHDITERKLSEAALRESEERYRKLVEFSPDAIAIHSEGKIVFINVAGAKLLGAVNPEQLIGKSVMDFVHLDYQEIVREQIRQLREEGKNVSSVEEKFIKLDGSVIDVEVTAIPFTYQGKPGIQIIVRDITDRKSAEEALKQSEEKYRTLIDNIQDGIFIIQDGKIQFANEAFAKVGEYTVEEVIEKDYRELVAPEDLEMVAERYQRRQAGEDVPHEYEFRMLHKNGRTRILVNMNVGLITYRDRVASMGTVKDITEKKRLESQLLRAQRMESIGTLASGIAHDINNVLTPIMLSQELLQEKLTDKESQRLLNTIERSTKRGANLMKQVMSFSKGVEGERNALQVKGIISEIEKIAKETFPRNIKIRTDIPKDLWSVSGDATQLHQVIMNLCVNARDAMSDGGILSISAENIFIDEDYASMNAEAKIGPYIIITVSDTGTGIPPEIMDRIFEPFFTTKEHGKGTGLGLSISLGIVKSHGGFITVYSEVGAGTAFKVYLPAIPTIETLKAEERQLELPTGHGESILVVDDEEQILEMTKKTLETHGYRVITANDGKEAIALYLQHGEEINLVLMDMMMPVMDGSASIRELCKVNPEIKIIAVSGLTEKDKLVKVDDVHVQAFLSKPYAAEKLLKTINDIISTK